MKKVAMLAVAAALLGISAPNFAQVPGSSQPSSTQQDDRDLDVGTSGSQSGSQTGTGTMIPGSDSIRKQQPGTPGSQSGSGTGTSGTGTGTSGSMSQYSQEVEVSDLPAAITMKISEKYAGFEADKAYKANDGSFKVMLKKDDAEKQTVYFDQKGEVIKAKSGTHMMDKDKTGTHMMDKDKTGTHMMDKDKTGSGTGASGSVSGTSGSVSGTGTGTSGSVSGTGTGTSGSVSGTGTGTSGSATSGSTGSYGTMPQQPGTSDSQSGTGTSGTSTQKQQDKKQSTGTSGSGTSTSGSGTGTSSGTGTGTGSSVGSSSSSMSSEYNEEVKASDLPAAITRSMNEKYPGYKTEKAHKAKDGTYKVTVSKGDEKQTLFFDARGESVKMQK